MTQREDRRGRAVVVAVACLRVGLVWLAWTTVAPAASPGAIDWRTDPQAARAESRATGRPLLIEFTGPWCHACKRMEAETFVAPKVSGLIRDRFIPVRLQCDLHEDLVLAANLTGIPATMIVKPSGEVVARHEGFVDPASFTSFLESSLGRLDATRQQVTSARPEGPTPKSDTVALSGYCPVSLVADHRLVPGKDEVTLRHEGRIYRFASVPLRKAFRDQPERYIPVNGGRCPVSQVDEGVSRLGDPHFGVLYEGHLYLCGDATSRTLFLKVPGRYAHVDVADRGFCPHCWGRDGLLVRGQPRHSLTRDGQRFLFPSPDHLEAFRSSEGSETTRR